MKFLILLCLTCTVFASLNEEREQWSSFKSKHGKLYKNLQEEKLRFSIFQQNLRTIEEHNEQFKAGNTTYTKGVNRFADLTKEEFVSFLNRKNTGRPNFETHSIYKQPVGLEIPDSIDWRERGAVSVVKDQGNCGSCWAFATTGVLESYYYLKNNQMLLFSEQQIVDCDTNNGGCDGGDEGTALYYVKDNGIETEDSYPYKARDQTCHYKNNAVVDLEIKQAIQLEEKHEGDLLNAVGSVGPLTVALDASYLDFYEGGVFTSDSCSKKTEELNHAVLAVGYGHDDSTGLDYWIVKNSWASDWGEDGFFKIRRGTDECGISSECNYIEHGKLYKNLQEEKMLFSTFQQNLRAIEDHNKQFEAGNTTYTKGINRFTDLTKEEIVVYLARQSTGRKLEADSIYKTPLGLTVPDSIDWRQTGAVSGVKDQSDCGSCWAFATTGVLESYYYLKNNQMLLFSEQQLLDCEPYGDCDGGDEGIALYYVKDYGIQTEDSYPYEAVDDTCRYDQNAIANLQINEVVMLQEKHEGDLLNAIGSVGPLAVAIDATEIVSYQGGVFTSDSCSKTDLNHAVLAVGYGHDSATGLDYWIVKNSWSQNWGDGGYFKIRRGTDECGISTECHYVILN